MFEGTKHGQIEDTKHVDTLISCVFEGAAEFLLWDLRRLRHREVLPKGSPTTSIEVLRSLPTLGAADVVLGGCLSDMAGHFCFSVFCHV